MCTGIEVALIAGTALSVGGQIIQGQQQKEMYKDQAKQTLIEGVYRADAAKSQAEKIRAAGRGQAGAANAALAKAGVKLGSGTPLEIQKSITENSEHDALTAILNGERAMSSAQQEAGLLDRAGRNAVTNSYYGAGSSVLQSGANYGMWKTTAKGY